MKLWKPDLPRKAQFLLMLACAVCPVAELAASGSAPGRSWIFAAAYLLLATACLLTPGRVRLMAGAAGGALLIGLGAAVLPVGEKPALFLLPAGYAALLLASLPMAAWPAEKEPRASWNVFGLVAHVLALAIADRPMGEGMRQAVPLMRCSFVLLFCLTLLSVNRASVRGAAQGKQRVPIRMRRANTLMTWGLAGLALAAGVVPGAARALRTLWDWLVHGVAALVAWLVALFPVPAGAPSGERGTQELSDMMFMEAAEPNALAELLERVLPLIALLVLLMLTAYILRVTYRRLKALARRLMNRLGRFAASASEDYEDEIMDTREEETEERLTWAGRLRRQISARGENSLPPRERIRHRYLRLRWKHAEWPDSRTAREAIPPEAASLYERARYSAHELSEAEAEAFAEGVKRL